MLQLAEFKKRVTEAVVTPMLAYMEECGEECEYKRKDVAKCEKLVLEYLTSLSRLKTPDDPKIMKRVKKLVLALNQLNARTEYSLIETCEREELWEIIQDAAGASGLNEEYDDVTEEWREW